MTATYSRAQSFVIVIILNHGSELGLYMCSDMFPWKVFVHVYVYSVYAVRTFPFQVTVSCPSGLCGASVTVSPMPLECATVRSASCPSLARSSVGSWTKPSPATAPRTQLTGGTGPPARSGPQMVICAAKVRDSQTENTRKYPAGVYPKVVDRGQFKIPSDLLLQKIVHFLIW